MVKLGDVDIYVHTQARRETYVLIEAPMSKCNMVAFIGHMTQVKCKRNEVETAARKASAIAKRKKVLQSATGQ